MKKKVITLPPPHQNDKATPVHLACAQRNLDMVKVMLESTKEDNPVVLLMQDAMDMTPLHTAALFDQTNIVEYLVSKVVY